MASPTKQIETIRKRKASKRLVARTKRIRSQMKRLAEQTPAELRRFIPGIVQS